MANGVDLREPLKPTVPADCQEITLPWGSVMLTMVLLNVDLICAAPTAMFLRSERLMRVRTCFLAATCLLPYFFLPPICLRGPLRVRAFVCVRWPRTGRPRR